MEAGKIVKVSGPLVVAEGLTNAKMYDVVEVGESRLIGEIIELRHGLASIQVYEETAGLGPEDPVYSTGEPLCVELGPGLISSIYDGVQRPLDILRNLMGDFVVRGADAPAIDREKKWVFEPTVKAGDQVVAGDIVGQVQETSIIRHRIMVPLGIKRGRIKEIFSGQATVEDTVAVVDVDGEKREITMLTRWPVRRPRPYKEKLPLEAPVVTGQRVIDTFFPITKGGTACVPGPFGSGKTVIQHQLAKWADSEMVVFVGCGERGNEMTDVLIEFDRLSDPYTGKPLMEKAILIGNTSNMPVAAREASIYTGITMAEYLRDMGYNVTLQADSTSRWAEALREISGRLEEMPGEEGYPAYLSSRLAAFYERAGRVKCLGNDNREGSVAVVGSVSPPGGDLSDPVVQATLRVVKVFWGLEDRLAYERHFPAINWLTSYSLYLERMEEYWGRVVAPDFKSIREEAMKILQRESELKEIVRLVGIDVLSPQDRILMETAKSIREDFLQQHAFDPNDTYTSLEKQYRMLKLIISFHQVSLKALEEGRALGEILEAKIKERIARAKFIPEGKLEEFDHIEREITRELQVSLTGRV
ncbi:MAG: V-type sodium ATPase catalytic subunit A [Actinobacteria bacterium]|nr:V-type sodium ATPase catalytic subunit A [Actinomycetota bacterium]